MALPLITAAREANVPTAYPNRRVSPVVTSTSSRRTPSSSAMIWANTVWWPCPCEVSPVDDVHPSGRVDLDMAALVGSDAGALHVAADPDAEPPAFGGRSGLGLPKPSQSIKSLIFASIAG